MKILANGSYYGIRLFRVGLIGLLSVSLLVTGCGNIASLSSTNSITNESKVDFPTKPIEVIVPYAPGGGNDVPARALSSVLSKYLPDNGSVVVVNKPGGAGTIGTTHVANSKPDGYKLGYLASSNVTIQPHFGEVSYELSDLETIIQVTSSPMVFLVKSDAPWKTLEELIDWVKKNPDQFTHSSAGVGSTNHINMEALNLALGLKTKHVPFGGNAPALTALLGGHVMGVNVQGYNALPYIESGELRALTTFGDYRPVGFEYIPLFKEKGIEIGIPSSNFLVVPKDLTKEIRDIFHDASKKALEDPELIEQFKKAGVEMSYAGPDELKKMLEETFKSNGEIMEKVGLTKE